MWIKRKRFADLEKRVTDLEKSQLRSCEMVKQYIEDTESMAMIMSDKISRLPNDIKVALANNSVKERYSKACKVE